MESGIETMGQELLSEYRAERYLRQKKEFEQQYGENSIQFVI